MTEYHYLVLKWQQIVVLPVTQYHHKLLHYNAKMQIRYVNDMHGL